MIRIGSNRIGRALVKDINVNGIYLGPKLVWGREVELLQMFKASVLADGGIFDEELFTTEFFRVHQTIRNEAIVLIVCGAYKAGIIYGINCITGQAVPSQFGRVGVGTYIDKYGKLQTAGANMPRIDYDPLTLVLRGYLGENGSTNISPNSLFNGNITGWNAQNCTPSYPATLSKRGRKFVELTKTSSGSLSNIAINSVMSGANTRIAYRATLRAGTSTSATIALGGFPDSVTNNGLWGDSSSTGFRKIDGPGTLTREVGTVIIVSGLSTTEDTEIEVWRQYTGNTSLQARVYPGSYVVANAGESCLFSTPQLEINALGVCTSQIDTDGSQQTRAADSWFGATSLLNNTESTVYVEGEGISGSGGAFFLYRGGPTSGDISHRPDGRVQLWDGTSMVQSTNTVPFGGKIKIAASFRDSANKKIALNGGGVTTNSYSGKFGNQISTLYMGYPTAGRRVHTRAFAILHRQLSDAEHISLTT